MAEKTSHFENKFGAESVEAFAKDVEKEFEKPKTKVLRSSLFDSLLGTEAQQTIDHDINKHANRVGVLLKILYGRELTSLRESFIDRLSLLVQDTANAIDNELSKTAED